MSSGASYSAVENIPTTCDAGNPYALVGYSTGATLAAAASSTVSTTTPSFSNLTNDAFILVWNKTCPQVATLKVHILKYLDGTKAIVVAANYQFPMTATWNAVNIGAGTGTYVLGTNFGGAADLYGADTTAMSAPADYSTAEITDNTSQVVASPELCSAGKYLLNGYRVSAISFADAATQPLAPTAAFTGLTADEYVIVDNSTCARIGSLTIQKDTIGGNGTFTLSGDGGIGTFQITTTGTSVGGTGSTTFANLAPGTYHISEATSSGWTLTDNECASVTVAAGAAPLCVITNTKNPRLGEISGSKIEDRDGDGRLKDGDHHRLSGWTIYLDTNNNGILDSGEATSTTDAYGHYHFIGLPAGTYHVREVPQSGWNQTYPTSGVWNITLSAGQIAKHKDFGNFKPGTITGMKFNDLNGNHHKDVGEPGLLGWTIVLKKLGGGPIATTTTDANGNYSFIGLSAGQYKLSEVMQATWRQTLHPYTVSVHSSTNATNRNFGNTDRKSVV